MRYYRILIFLFFILGLLQINAQQTENDILARVGDIKISADEFIQRYELTPGFGKENPDNNLTSKLNFLYTLVAEKLWAEEAKNLMLENSEVMKFTTEQFKKMFVRDELFQREIKDKIHISDDEIIEGLFRNAVKLKVKFLFSEDQTEIENLYSLLEEGIPFDSILVERSEYKEQPEPIEVVYGQMSEDVEDSLYNLEVGKFTRPILTPDGWYIFYLKNKIEQQIIADKEIEDADNSVRKVLETRKINNLFSKYYKEFFSDKKVDVDANLFKSISEKISKIFKEKNELYEHKNEELFNLNSADILQIEKELGNDTLQMSYINFDENPITVKEFIRIIAFNGFEVQSYELSKVRGVLDLTNKKLIEQVLLAREGLNQNLQLSNEVQEQVEIWKQNYLAQLLRNKFLDSVSVSEGEIRTLYNQRFKEENYPPLVNIIEVLTNDNVVVQKVLSEIEKGTDLRKLAVEYSGRETVIKNNGETGLVPIHSLGKIGEIAYKTEINKITGPIKVENGFSIFKVIEKQDEKVVMPKPFEVVKDELERDIRFKKLKYKMMNYTANLAIKYGVGINNQLLKSIEVTNINSFGYRNLGFGGRITAVPLMAPNFEWVDLWQNKLENINP